MKPTDKNLENAKKVDKFHADLFIMGAVAAIQDCLKSVGIVGLSFSNAVAKEARLENVQVFQHIPVLKEASFNEEFVKHALCETKDIIVGHPDHYLESTYCLTHRILFIRSLESNET